MLVDGPPSGGRTGLVLALAAAAALALAGTASAACGGVEQVKPRKDVNLGRAPIAIGDSSMLLALPELAREGYRANARGCRQWAEGMGVLRQQRKLPRLVVMALGADGVVTRSDIHDALGLLGKKRTLGLVTPIELGGHAGRDADIVKSEAKRHPNRITLLNWVDYSRGHPGWFQPDGLHLTLDGRGRVREAAEEAAQGSAKTALSGLRNLALPADEGVRWLTKWQGSCANLHQPAIGWRLGVRSRRCPGWRWDEPATRTRAVAGGSTPAGGRARALLALTRAPRVAQRARHGRSLRHRRARARRPRR